MLFWGQAPLSIFIDFLSVIFCYKYQMLQFLKIFAHHLYFPQGIEATEKLEQDHAVSVEALKEELAKVKSAGEEIVPNFEHITCL